MTTMQDASLLKALADSGRRLLGEELYWNARYFWPMSIRSRLAQGAPVVTTFGDQPEAGFIQRIRQTNVFAPTRMCRVMTAYGSDKGRGYHNYTTVYSTLLNERTKEALNIFELGLGSKSPDYEFSMGAMGRPGASLRGWAACFPHAQVFGADIDRSALFEEPRIRTYFCDQLDQQLIGEMWVRPELRSGMDVVLDDGLHTFEANVTFLEGSIDRVRPGGFYIVEDIATKTLDHWKEQIQSTYVKRYDSCSFALVQLPSTRNKTDNNLLVVRQRDV